jgi:hypothetical protein
VTDKNTPIEVKPATFARGVPAEQHNGFFGDGLADRLLGLDMDTQIVAIVTFRLSDDVTKKGARLRYPVMSIDHIEPLWDDDSAEAAKELQLIAYEERTGQDQLDFAGVESEAGEQ